MRGHVVDNRPGTRGHPRNHRWKSRSPTWTNGLRAWTSTKSAKPPHLAVAAEQRPLHLVVLALTTATHRRIVLEVAHSTETPEPRPAIGTIRRPGARPQEPSDTLTTRRTRQLPRRDAKRRSNRWPEARPAASPSTTRSSPSRRPPQAGAAHDRPPPPRRPLRRELRRHGSQRQARQGPDLRAPLDPPGRPSLRRDHLGVPDRRHRQRDRQERLRAEGRRGPQLLVPARHERRRSASTSAATSTRPSARPASSSSSIASSTRSRPGPRPSATSRRDEDLATFKAELTHLIVHQKMAFNSPVWFNVGIEEKPQCSACFINSVQDTMSSHHGPRQDRGHALQVRLGRRQQPLHDPQLQARRWPAAARPAAPSPS